VSTAVGRGLIATLPELATRPDMTALWEAAMRRIAEGRLSLTAFLEAVSKQLRELIDAGRALRSLSVPGARRCTAPGCTGYMRHGQGPRGPFWSCTRFPGCKQTAAVESSGSSQRRGRARGKRTTRSPPRHSEPT
jgi:DNA topoisomerase-3